MARNARANAQSGYARYGEQDPEKKAILRFFKASEYDWFAAGYITDEVTGEETNIAQAATVRDGFC